MTNNKYTKGANNYYSAFDVSALGAMEGELRLVASDLEAKLKAIRVASIHQRFPTEEDFVREVKTLIQIKDAESARNFAKDWCGCPYKDAFSIVQEIILESLDKEALDKELSALIESGKIIEAIKKYRNTYGCYLTEAKCYVDSLQERMNKEKSEKLRAKYDEDLLEKIANIGEAKANRY